MSLFGFSRRAKPKNFTYIPRFYDEEEEKRKEFFGNKEGDEAETMKSRISKGMKRRSSYYDKPNVSQYRKKSNILTLVIVVVLVILIITVLGNNLESILKLGE